MTETKSTPSAAANDMASGPDSIDGQAASLRLDVLRRRADFVLASKAGRQATPGFHLQARRRSRDEAAAGIRIGFTCSKKVGNAVARNKAKRRLREIARLELPLHGQNGWDYVLVGKRGVTATHDFAALRRDLVEALQAVHARVKAR